MLLKAEQVLGMVFPQKKIGKKYNIDSVDEAMEYFAAQLDCLYAGEETDIQESHLEEYLMREEKFMASGYDKDEVDVFLYKLMLTIKGLKKEKLSDV